VKLQFKKQTYQINAVNAVVKCFEGQPNTSAVRYQVDPGKSIQGQQSFSFENQSEGFKNSDVLANVLANIQKVQQQQNLNVSQKLIQYNSPCEYNLNVEMETGTGKTYVYIKTMFELNKQYGWSKFIIVVPSIAIRKVFLSQYKLLKNIFWKNTARKLGHLFTILVS